MRSFVLTIGIVGFVGAFTTGAFAQEDDVLAIEPLPLVDVNAPLVAFWFFSEPTISSDVSTAIRDQLGNSLSKRIDIRLITFEKTRLAVEKKKRPDLLSCQEEDSCMLAVGRLLGVQRIIGGFLKGSKENYHLVLKSFRLDSSTPEQLNSATEGGFTELIVGGVSDAISALFDNNTQPVPANTEQPQPRLNALPNAR
jgi:hypothetical protein